MPAGKPSSELDALASFVAGVLRHPAVAGALRDAVGAGAKDPDGWTPVKVAAAELGVRPRVLLDAGRRGDLSVRGPRGARVVRRGDLDTWLESRGIVQPDDEPEDDERAEARSAVAVAAARFARKCG